MGEIQTVLVHTCTQKIDGYIEKKCRCRKFIPVAKAEELVSMGDAEYVTDSIKWFVHKLDCDICGGQKPYMQSCKQCGGKGFTEFKEPMITTGNDVYMTSAMKTPRTPTIEANHILRQFAQKRADDEGVDRDFDFTAEAQARIAEYGWLDAMILIELGAELRRRETGEVLMPGTPEPENDAKAGTGEKYDWGRSI